MATVGVVADVAPEPHLAGLPTTITSYNITLNLTSILSFIPGSSLFARFRKGMMHQQTVFGASMNGGDSISQASESLTSLGDWTTASISSMLEDVSTGAESPQTTAAINQAAQVPSPWGFFTSGYMIGLFIMVCHILTCEALFRLTGLRLSSCTGCRISYCHHDSRYIVKDHPAAPHRPRRRPFIKGSFLVDSTMSSFH